MSLGRNGNSWLRRRLSARRPWNRPQSRSSVRPQASTRCREPVTVRAAPQKVTVGSADGLGFAGMEALYAAGVAAYSIGAKTLAASEPRP